MSFFVGSCCFCYRFRWRVSCDDGNVRCRSGIMGDGSVRLLHLRVNVIRIHVVII